MLAAIAARAAQLRLTRKEPRMRHSLCISAAIALFLSLIETALPCTGFLLRDGNEVIVCFSFDHQFGAGHLYVNKRNVERQRYLLYAERPLAWVSKYGNVTFNLVGRDWPHDGMNEMGLVILSMGLDDTKFQAADARVPFDENGWIQYQLDNSASVADVLENMKKIRISGRAIGDSHFLIVDRSGIALVIEYVDGKELVYTGESLPHAILANDTYAHMLGFLSQQKVFGGTSEDTFRVGSSRSRFARVAERLRLRAESNDPSISFAFSVLAEMKQSNTQYQVVYDASARSIQFRSGNCSDVKSISFDECDFACSSPVLMADIQSFSRGNISSTFSSYDPARSKDALRLFNRSTFQYFPEEALAAIAEAPLKSDCRDVLQSDLPSHARENHDSGSAHNSLTATLHALTHDSVLVIGGDNVAFDFQIQINRPLEQDIDVVIEVPDTCALIPARHFFLAPNPVRIPRGETCAKVHATLISDNIGKGTDQLLIAGLVGDRIQLRAENELAVRIRKVAVSK